MHLPAPPPSCNCCCKSGPSRKDLCGIPKTLESQEQEPAKCWRWPREERWNLENLSRSKKVGPHHFLGQLLGLANLQCQLPRLAQVGPHPFFEFPEFTPVTRPSNTGRVDMGMDRPSGGTIGKLIHEVDWLRSDLIQRSTWCTKPNWEP